MSTANSAIRSIRVTGTGSLMGADQLGLLAARKLAAGDLRERYPGVHIDIDTCLSPSLLPTRPAPGQALILLDAYFGEDPPACVRRVTAAALETVQRPASTHGFDLPQALAVLQALHDDRLPVAIIGICAGSAPDAADLQAPGKLLETALPALLGMLGQIIGEWASVPAAHTS
ncbi:MAG TPA: hypothetical protein ENJ12_09810 [Thiolapillus brandeum]|uniref:Hydrogenase maturation protease n=1 Tax=Thiolapillus brandeum TaxID=1076588 RepID=A0A831RZJ4_9GAMM|nr:hypothetical protein [Thiolapillus brandeum]